MENDNKKLLKSYTLRIDIQLFKKIKLYTLEQKITIKEYLIGIIEDDLKKKGL